MGLSDTCGSTYFSGRTGLCKPAATAVPSLLAPGHSFQLREASLRAAGAESGLGRLIFGTHIFLGFLRRGPKDLLVALRGVVESRLRFVPQGADWPWPPVGTLRSFCLHGNNPVAQVLCMFCSSCGLVGAWAASLPLDAETWGQGCWGIPA